MTNNFDPNQLRGQPSNKGSWVANENGEPESTLGVHPDVIAEHVAYDETLIEELDHDGSPLVITRYPLNLKSEYTSFAVFDNDKTFDFLTPANPSSTQIRQAAVSAFDTERAAVAKSRLGQMPALDGRLQVEIERLTESSRRPGGILAPTGWDGDYELRSAASMMGDEFEKDEAGDFSDYGFVSQEGVYFGKYYDSDRLARILVGEQGVDEDDYDYKNRWQDAAHEQDTWETMSTSMNSRYGALLNAGLNDDKITVDFLIPFGDGETADTVSFEAMREKAAENSKLVWVSTNFDEHEFDRDLAADLGYRFDVNVAADTNGANYGGRYVRISKTAAI